MFHYAIQSAFNLSTHTTPLPTGLVKGISDSIATLFKPVNQERKRLRDEVNDAWGSHKRQKVDVLSRFCTPETKEMTQHTMVLMDFPDEIILLILRDVTLREALPLLQCNWRLRSVISQFYLKHHGFVIWDDNADDITLQGDVPAAALRMLSVYPFVNRITLCCDLYYLVEYRNLLLSLLCQLKALIYFNIYFNPLDLALLHDPRTPNTIYSAITALPGGIYAFKISRAFDPPPVKALSQPPHPRSHIHHCGLSRSIS